MFKTVQWRVGIRPHNWGKTIDAAAALAGTIRGRIFVAFIAMIVITGALGLFAASGINAAGELVTKTFDESLMSINYARAAAADFAQMQAAFARRWIAQDAETRTTIDASIDDFSKTLGEDLLIAADRSQSARAAAAAGRVREAVAGWDKARRDLVPGMQDNIGWGALDAYAADVGREIDLLINYTAGDGFTYRQKARATVATDMRINLIGTGVALALLGMIAWLLARRIIGPVAMASSVARRIARGQLDGTIPPGSDDELGMLLSSMGLMRDNIKSMMASEVAMRQSAQMRLADALDSSLEGIIVIDAEHRVALFNPQAADFLGGSPGLLKRGVSIEDLAKVLTAQGEPCHPLLNLDGVDRGGEEARLADGRWLRVSRSSTRDGGFITLCSDISVQKDQEAKLQATNLRLDAALDNMSQGLCLYGEDLKLKVVNRRFCEIFGLSLDLIQPGIAFNDVLALSVAAGNFPGKSLEDVVEEETRFLGETERTMRFLKIGEHRVVGIAQEALSDGGWLATYEDVTERRLAEERIAFMARHDSLTNLPNRMLFAERINMALAQAKRGRGCAVFCLDLDHFKHINDTLGHLVGDDLLRAVAERLTQCTREIDTVARLGGDEFAVVQSGIDNPNEAVALANRIIEVLSAPFPLDGHSVTIGVSVGVSIAPEDGQTYAKLLKNADVALYRAKEEGRGTWRFFEPDMDARLQARRSLELDLRHAVELGQFDVHYQPLFDLRSDRIVGFETLCRWKHPARGQVSPADFIPIAEELGVIRELGQWVLHSACMEAARWPGSLKVAVNVSPVQLQNADFFGTVSAALAASGLPPQRLELEITETVMLANNAAAHAMLHKLHDLGIKISMDDFGTGYSSLSSLRSFPFDKIKIDKSFVQDLSESQGAELVIRAIIILGGGLGMRITAEGVETAEQMARLRIEGCNEVQGYFISHPAPASEIPKMLDRWNNPSSRRSLIAAVA